MTDLLDRLRQRQRIGISTIAMAGNINTAALTVAPEIQSGTFAIGGPDADIVEAIAEIERLRDSLSEAISARQAWAPAITAALDEFNAPHDTGDLEECVRGIRALGEYAGPSRQLLADALPIVQAYASANPCWTNGIGPTQDPNGAHAWLCAYAALEKTSPEIVSSNPAPAGLSAGIADGDAPGARAVLGAKPHQSDAGPHPSRWAGSGNYVADREVAPTRVTFANGRVAAIKDGALVVGWTDTPVPVLAVVHQQTVLDPPMFGDLEARLRQKVDLGEYDGYGNDPLHVSAADALRDLRVALASQIEITNTERAAKGRLERVLSQDILLPTEVRTRDGSIFGRGISLSSLVEHAKKLGDYPLPEPKND